MLLLRKLWNRCVINENQHFSNGVGSLYLSLFTALGLDNMFIFWESSCAVDQSSLTRTYNKHAFHEFSDSLENVLLLFLGSLPM